MATHVDDQFIRSGDLSLAVQDHGGDGPALVLLPGGGRTILDFELMLPVLTERHRVVAADLRCHGRSDSGPWDWDAVVDDVRAVVDHLGLERPAVAGHSLGGMVAALYGERFEDCRAAVNIDGHGEGRPDQYVGFTEAEVREKQAQMTQLAEAQMAAMPATLTAEQVDAARAGTVARAEQLGVPEETAVAGFDRGLQANPDGTFSARPSLAENRAIIEGVRGLDLFALYRRVRCPLLVYNATRVDPMPGAPEFLPLMMAAYRTGLARDLAALAAETPHVRVSTIDATHALIIEQPESIAREISDFVLAAELAAVAGASQPG